MNGTESPYLEPLDTTSQVFHTLTLYALAEYQSGHATALALSASGNSFSVSDNGRGHGISRTVEGVPYLHFIYSHLDYPFSSSVGGGVQLQGLGMSLLNSLCSELRLTIRKPQETLLLTFRAGRLCEERRVSEANGEGGNTVQGEVRPELQPRPTAEAQLEEWLRRVQRVHPGLNLSFNGKQLTGESDSAANPSLKRRRPDGSVPRKRTVSAAESTQPPDRSLHGRHRIQSLQSSSGA